MENKIYTLRFRAVNRDTWNAIKTGRKKIETRAATERYKNIKKGDTLKFVCGRSSFSKKVKRTAFFRTIAALFGKYKIQYVNPGVKTIEESRRICYRYTGYREKIKKYGLVALELK